MNKIQTLKLLDSAGRLLMPFLPRPSGQGRRAAGKRALRILFIRPGGIGDAALLIPAIAALKRKFPASTIDVLAEIRNSGVFALCSEIDGLLHYDRPGELLRAIRMKYDVVIDTEQWHRLSAIVARLCNAPMSLGFATNERKKLFTHPAAYSHDTHEADSFLELIKPLIGEVPFEREKAFLAVPDEARSTVEKLLQPLGTAKFVALFPGSSIQERKWGADRFHGVAKLLAGRGCGIVVTGAAGDIRDGEKVVQGISNGLNLCGSTSLPETAALLQRSALLISGDSGIMHIGYGVGTKIVALFGPGRSNKWAPQGSRCRVINKELACSPCTTFGYTPRCTRSAACMKAIAVSEVFDAAITLLG